MKRVLIYIRVSTTKQEQEGYSVGMQKDRLLSYCSAMGWVPTGIYIDPGFSGASLDRPGMVELIEAIEAGKGDVVLVYKMDRLSRSQRDLLYLLEDVFDPNGVAFVSMQESFDTATVFGRAVLGILSVFAQMERSTISERTLMGRVGRAEDGKWHGGGDHPIGYDYVDGELVVNEEEAEQVRTVYKLFAEGHTVSDISRMMDGHKTKHGDWRHTSTVGNVLDNALYAGLIRFEGVRSKGDHPAIVDVELNRRVKARRERLRKADAAARDSSHLLTGMVFCAECGARYFPNKRPNGKVVYSCHSRAKKNKKMMKAANCAAPHWPVEKLDAMVEAEVLRLAADPALVRAIKKAAQKGSSDAGQSEEIQRIDAEISSLMELYRQEDQSIPEVAEKISLLHARRAELSPVSTIEKKATERIDIHKSLLREISTGWHDMDMRGRRNMLLQLIDRIDLDAGDGVRIEWSFANIEA